MDNYDITLAKIRNKNNIEGSNFLSLYSRLILGDSTLDINERFFLLKIAVLFLNSKDENIERLGYRIILRYSNIFNDYEPLYDVALSREYIPITKFIERKYFSEEDRIETFSRLYMEAFQEGFKIEGDDSNVYRSLGQIKLYAFSAEQDNIAVVAPTSYGKSELIIKKIQTCEEHSKVCVLVPSKALLAQTKKALLKNDSIKAMFKKIITHPDMYKSSDTGFLAVLTQERLLRLLQKNKELALDLVLVDEAHNILEDDDRSHLLAQVLLILQNRNSNVITNFFTPFLADVDNLAIRNYNIKLKGQPLNEYMKVERFYGCDLEERSYYLYDQFLNRTLDLKLDNNIKSDSEFILKERAKKNIIYVNRPMKVEEFALTLVGIQPDIELTAELRKVIGSISDFIHPEYNLIKCLRKGILYHHGGIPDIVRLFIEDIYSKYSSFEFIITTSTLLEGVNIPAEKIFILTPSKGIGYLSASQFKNLIGRVCRFREVFNDATGSLKMLEPEIYLIKGGHAPKNLSLLDFYKKRVSSSVVINDEVDNPLLEKSKGVDGLNDILEYLENMENGSSGLDDVEKAKTEIGKLCFENNIHDFNIIENESQLNQNMEDYIQLGFVEPDSNLIKSPESLIDAIINIFFEDIELNIKSENIIRLKENEEARKFYSMFIGWRTQGSPFPKMIVRFLKYWRKQETTDPIIYVGPTWGELSRSGSHKTLYVDITSKTETQRINLAITRIKGEQEFIDFNILKYLEILFELRLVDQEFYEQVKYGTSNGELICLLKNGFSMELARLLTKEYHQFLQFNLEQDLVHYERDLVDAMIGRDENDILIFEAENNL